MSILKVVDFTFLSFVHTFLLFFNAELYYAIQLYQQTEKPNGY